MNGKIPVVLVVSTGAQDIKIWVSNTKHGDTKFGQVPIPGERCRRVHEQLWPEPSQPKSFLAQIERQLDPQEEKLTSVTVGQILADANLQEWRSLFENHEFHEDRVWFRDGKLLLSPAKTMNLISALCPAAADVEIKRVVILYSEREGWPKEPIRNGVALGDWLGRELGLTPIGNRSFDTDEAGVRWVNYLDGLKFYEGSVDTVNFPLHTCAARAIEEAIANAASDLTDAYVVYSTRGGFDDVKPIVAAACAIHFDGRTHCFWETERSKTPPGANPITGARLRNEATFAVPAETLAARALALGRLREGDVLGAWGAVAHLSPIQDDRLWLDLVDDLARFFRGEDPSQSIRTAIGVTAADATALLLRAFQVEAALQGDRKADWRVTEALIATTAIIDLALETGVIRALQEDHYTITKIGSLAENDRVAIRERIKAIVESHSEWRTDLNWFPGLFLGDGRINTMKGDAAAWRIWLSQRSGPSYQALAAALTDLDDYAEKRSIREYRNQLAHRTLSDPLKVLKKASSTWNRGGHTTLGPLWQRVTQFDDVLHRAPSEVFLTSPLIVPLFAALDIPDPAERYRRLLGLAMDALRVPVTVSP